AGPPPSRTLVPGTGRPSRRDDPARLDSLAKEKDAIACADLPAARAAPIRPQDAGTPEPGDVRAQVAPGIDARIPGQQKRAVHSGSILPRPQPLLQLDPLHLAGGALGQLRHDLDDLRPERDGQPGIGELAQTRRDRRVTGVA